jgi:enterochelin esterase family protein
LAWDRLECRRALPQKGTSCPAAAAAAFSQDLIGDLLPVVQKTFRASNRAEDRAIAGLSAGGAATINASFSRPDLFRYIVIMSAGGQNVEQSYPKFFANSAAGAKQMKLIWLGVGDADFALNGMNALAETLKANGIEHTYRISPGYRHEWRLWRPHLHEFAQLLFRNAKKGTS